MSKKRNPEVGLKINARKIVQDLTGLNEPVAGFINQSELNKLMMQNEALKEALRPFAKFLRAIPQGWPDSVKLDPQTPESPTFGDLRRAAYFLAFLETEEEETFLANFKRKLELAKGPKLPGT